MENLFVGLSDSEATSIVGGSGSTVAAAVQVDHLANIGVGLKLLSGGSLLNLVLGVKLL